MTGALVHAPALALCMAAMDACAASGRALGIGRLARLRRPARFRHLHLRDGASLTSVVPFTARVFGRAVVMPNLKPPVRTLAEATAYRQRVLAAVPHGVSFEPLMTLYLTGALRPVTHMSRVELQGCPGACVATRAADR
jgi:hypothetical protein